MATTFSLDDIRKAAEAKFGSTDIDLGDGKTLVMVNPLRLPKDKRNALEASQESAEVEGADQGDVMRDAIRIVASSEAMAEEFIRIAGDDLGILAAAFSLYTEGAQVGEASASQD